MLLLVLVFPVGYLHSQDLSFSQIYSNHIYLNPAYAGNPDYISASLVYRNQWFTTKSPFTTYGFSYDRFYRKVDSGLGFNLINDVQGQGAINRITFDLAYSYTFRVSYDMQLRGGIQAGGIIKSKNPNGLIFPDMINLNGRIEASGIGTENTTLTPDFAVGVAGEWKRFYGGFAVHHIAQPSEVLQSDESIPLHRKYTFHFGGDFNVYKRYLIKEGIFISPNVVFIRQHTFQQINLGAYVLYEGLVAGFWISDKNHLSNHTYIFIAGYQSNNMYFAYSYDFSLFQGGFWGLTTSTHEVTFGMLFQYKSKVRKNIKQIKKPFF